MDDMDFTEEEIKEQLESLGYHDVPQQRLRQFKQDLEQLVSQERSVSSSNVTSNADTSDAVASYSCKQNNDRSTRYPLDEASNRHAAYTYRINGTSGEHASYGKENFHSGQPRYFQKEDYDRRAMEPKVQFPTSYSTCKPAIHIPAPAVDYTHLPDTEYSMYSEQPGDISIASTTSSDRRVIKRKVLRKRDGLSEVFDESVTESDPEISQLQERLRNLPVGMPSERPKSARCERPVSRPHSSRETPCYRLPDDFEGPKALIRPMTSNPHTKNIRKNDPVSRYQQYQQSWQSQRAPGEKTHNSLRWNVREQMLYHDEVVEKKPQKSFIPNNYVVPSDKRRKNLRWQIRNDLAQGVIPPSAYD